MIEKYFMHRIQKENGSFSKGIEIHDTLDSAILSYHGRMKLAYGANPAITFMDCKITVIPADSQLSSPILIVKNTLNCQSVRFCGYDVSRTLSFCLENSRFSCIL